MDTISALDAFAALAQPTRLDGFRALVRAEPIGIPAGELARQLGVPQNTMSAHLSVLSRAGLVRAQRVGRSILYRADLNTLHGVLLFLVQDCCGARPEVCAPLLAALSPCCPPSAAIANPAKEPADV